MLRHFRHWLARVIAPDLFWNGDASRLIDHLTAELEEARARIAAMEADRDGRDVE